jgi:ABC-type nitrate/sulfonate/bicarbonate transport system ATPase subunit
MAQRLAIARGLVHDPAVVLLDEPFTGLDRGAAERLAARLAALRDDGRTLVLVTHDAIGAAVVADAALVLVGGRTHFAMGRVPDDPGALERAYLQATGDAA